MDHDQQHLSPADAARLLGVSPKALRVYEERELLAPTRTEAGWRTYGPEAQERVKEIVALRALGLSLRQISDVFSGDYACLGELLGAHQKSLERDLTLVSGQVSKVADLRARLALGERPPIADLASLVPASGLPTISFELPWPWGGERFELPALAPITFLTGPLGSGKTRLAQAIAEHVEGGVFVRLEREAKPHNATHEKRVHAAVEWIEGEGGCDGVALRAVLAATEGQEAGLLVFDLIEHGLDESTQHALIDYLRTRASSDRPLILMTRSTAILDLEAARPDERIIYCPPNHSPPILVSPHPGSAGYEAVATSLAPPDVRARTEGVVVIQAGKEAARPG